MRTTVTFVALLACAGPGPERPPFAVFPSRDLVVEGRVRLPTDLPSAATPVPIGRVAWRTGFSPAQTAVFRLGGLDAASLPGLDAPVAGGSVQVWDLTDGVEIGAFAELDVWPDDNPEPVLLVRPLRPVPNGHETAVVVTSAVRTAEGGALARPAWFAALAEGRPAEGQEALADDARALLDRLAALGVDDVAVATSWPVDDGTRQLAAMVAAAAVPAAYTLTRFTDVDEGDPAPPFTWRQAQGSFTVTDWLLDEPAPDVALQLDGDGLPTPVGSTEVTLFVHVPDSVRDAAPGSAPVWIFGHGIFSSPSRYLADVDDPSSVLALADRAGAIVIGTVWRGLTLGDLATPTTIGTDFGRFPELTEKLAQGVANHVELVRLIREGDLLDDPVFAGKADPSTLRYHGISLGGIQGATLLAVTPEIPHGVLHVGGGAWSTMLERSQNWTLFEGLLVESGLDDPQDRQLLYSLSQLFWDPVDPVNWTARLRDRSVLWQIALGDDQVSNLASWMVLRGAGARVVQPGSEVRGLSPVEVPAAGPAVAIYDPEQGSSDDRNRPAADSSAHDDPRGWPGCIRQTARFLDPADPGVVETFCGDAPCSASNPGSG
jgi:hypothetical protein